MSFSLDRFKIQAVEFFKSPREEAEYFLAYHREKKQDKYLLKIYTVRNNASEERVNNEVNMNFKAQAINQNIIKVKGVTRSQSFDPNTQIKDRKIIILMQYVNQNLADVIRFKKVASENQYITPPELKMQMKTLIKTFADLQRDNISHRRIDLESIYFVNQNAPLLVGDFYHSKNLIGQQDSEIRQIDQSEIKQMRFPDKHTLQCLINGQSELKSNYYKMDVYTLGIVFIQLATLEIYEGLTDLERQQEYAIQQIGERYGRNIQEFISLMFAPREQRMDFIGLEQIMDGTLDQENGQEQNILCSIYPVDKNNLSSISESSVREDLSSSSSSGNFERDESVSSLTQNSSLPFRFNSSRNPKWPQSELVSGDEQKHEYTQSYNDQISHQNTFSPLKPSASNSALNHQRPKMNPSISEKKLSNYDQILQVPIQNSIEFNIHQKNQMAEQQNWGNTRTEYPHEMTHPNQGQMNTGTVPIMPNMNFYDYNYQQRSTLYQSQIKNEEISYQDLVKKAKTLTKLAWFDRKSISKISNLIGRGRLSEVRECETTKRNCCIVKMYYKKHNTEVWDMLKSLNNFNQVQCHLVIKIEGYYLNPIEGSQFESELWLIQKHKKYNLITFQQRFNISLKERLAIAMKLTETIRDLHQNDISHGDIKPQNILVDLNQNPFLTDFVVCESMIGPSQLTRSRGYETGYSAPEQYNDMQFCKNSDIWSLGIIFFELIIGNKMDPSLVQRMGLYCPKKQGCLDLVQDGHESYKIISTLIKQMTQYNPDRRLPLDQIIIQLQTLEAANQRRQVQQRTTNVQQRPVYQQEPQPTIKKYQETVFTIQQATKKAAAVKHQMYKK